jgi:hypothetical protein
MPQTKVPDCRRGNIETLACETGLQESKGILLQGLTTEELKTFDWTDAPN